MKTKYALSLFTAILIASLQMQAQVPMSLDDCINEARENNLKLRSGKIAIARAKDLQATTFDLDKTSISLSQTPTTGGGPENALNFSQSFEFPTVYGARRSKLKAETQLEETKYELDCNTLESEVASTYYTLMYVKERKRLFAVQDTIYSHFLAIAEARHTAGESGGLERMTAHRLYEGNRMDLGNAEQVVANAQLQLGNWLNTDKKIVPADTTLKIIEYGEGDALQFNAQNVPSVAVASQSNVVAEKNLRLARQSFMPDISLGFSTQLLIKGFNPYNVDRSRFTEGDFMGFDVGISIPLFYGAKRARVRAAKKDVEQSRLLLEQETKNAATNFSMAQNEFFRAKRKLEYFRNHGNGDATETYKLAQLSYEKGDIEYLEYIQNLQAALQLQMDYAEAINEYNQALIRLRYIQAK